MNEIPWWGWAIAGLAVVFLASRGGGSSGGMGTVRALPVDPAAAELEGLRQRGIIDLGIARLQADAETAIERARNARDEAIAATQERAALGQADTQYRAASSRNRTDLWRDVIGGVTDITTTFIGSRARPTYPTVGGGNIGGGYSFGAR